MIDGKYAIITGLMGFDCEHDCGAELHPVYALAIRVKDDPADEVWAIFVRNWGNEGYCGTSQHLLPLTSYTFRLPWRPGASAVNVVWGPNATQFLTNDSNATGPNVTYAVGGGVQVNFTLSPPHEDGTRINGQLHLQWTGAQVQRFMPLPLLSPVRILRSREIPEEIEKRLAAEYAKMTPQQRTAFTAKLPEKTVVYDNTALKRTELKVVPHLPSLKQAKLGTLPKIQTQRVKAVRKPQIMQQNTEAWHTILGEQKLQTIIKPTH
jgi:hypothetical protein